MEGHGPRSADGFQAEVHLRAARGQRDEQRFLGGLEQRHRCQQPLDQLGHRTEAGSLGVVAQGDQMTKFDLFAQGYREWRLLGQ